MVINVSQSVFGMYFLAFLIFSQKYGFNYKGVSKFIKHIGVSLNI